MTLTLITQTPIYQLVETRWIKNLDGQFLIIKATVDDNRQAFDEKILQYDSKLDNRDSKLDKLTSMIKKMMDQNQNSLQDKMDSQKYQDSTTLVPTNKKAPPLEYGDYTKLVVCGLS